MMDALLVSEKVDEEVLESCPNIKILSRFGSGYNSIDLTLQKIIRLLLLMYLTKTQGLLH